MARATLSGTATVISASEDIAREGFDSTAWELELEVRPDGQSSYRVSGQFTMPNRMHKLRKTLSGPPKLAAGVVLPIAIEATDPQRIEILWKEVIRSGGMSQLYGEQFSAKRLINDVRDAVTVKTPPAPPSTAPASPRPTAKTFPPIGGVDFDTYIAAVLPVARGDVKEADLIAHYEASGFPVGRVPAIGIAGDAYTSVKLSGALANIGQGSVLTAHADAALRRIASATQSSGGIECVSRRPNSASCRYWTA